MSALPAELPDDIEALKALVRQQEHRIERDSAHIEDLRQRVDALQGQIRILLDHRFGRASERIALEDASQAGLFDEAEQILETADEESENEGVEVKGHRRRPKRAPLPDHLPRIDIEHDLPDSEKVCPHDGSALVRIGQETSEQLDIVPAKVQVLRHIRHKYACPCCDQSIRLAPRPQTLLPKSQASAGMLAYLVTSKFVDGLPLYRLENMLGRVAIDVPRQTLAGWMIATGQRIEPLIDRLNQKLLASAVIQMDETTVQVLKEPGRSPESKSYMWVRTAGDEQGTPIRLFDYAPSRSGQVPMALLEGFAGTLHTDGYDGYDAVARTNELKRAYCWAHARRHFVNALKAMGISIKHLPAKPLPKAKRLLKAIRFIQQLYGIEAKAREMSAADRAHLRQTEAVPILKDLRDWMQELVPKVLPSSGLGKALAYLNEHWDGLTVYVKDGDIAMDTNRTENSIRPFVLGRKAWLFAASVAGAKSSAALYSLVETAKANGHEPYAYLREVFERLPSADTDAEIDALLPWNLARA
ncbi:MAG: IS66 family transposase [Burkholderiaceae bacterium]